MLEELTQRPGPDVEEIRRHVARRIDEFAIKIAEPQNAVSTLSGGNQQRVVLAKWIATQPKVLILDCPTVGVDVAREDGIYEFVRRSPMGVAILMISDEIPEVFFHSHRVLVMRQGRLVGECIPHEFVRSGIAGGRRCVSRSPSVTLAASRPASRRRSALPAQPRILALAVILLLLRRAFAGDRRLSDAAESLRSSDLLRLRRHPCRRPPGRADRRRHRYFLHRDRVGRAICRAGGRHPLWRSAGLRFLDRRPDRHCLRRDQCILHLRSCAFPRSSSRSPRSIFFTGC